MADDKSPPAKQATAKDLTDGSVADISGNVSNLEGGFGTRQREPRPEDYPRAAKVTPVAEQLNTAASQCVGHATDGVTLDSSTAKSAQAAIDAAVAKTDEHFADKADDFENPTPA
jgi:hypothetical protein